MAGPTIRLTFAGDSTDLEKAMGRVGNSADQMEKTFSSKAKGLAVAGAGAAVGLSAAFANSLEFDSAAAKLTAQMGNGAGAAQAGAVAGELYANAYGENLGAVNEAVRAVMQSGAVMAGASNEEIQGVTANVMSLAEAFGQDTVGATNAVAQMMKTGLAPNAQAALDILTVGFQQGNDKAGDLLDTFNEYGTQFRKVGLDGQTAMGLISQGLQAGARDADIVADSIKEFSIRAIDGSKTTADGFAAIGLNAQDMAAKIAAGGPTASAALDLTLDRLRGMKDPTDQAAAAVALFGTQAEDMGAALYSLDPSSAVSALGQVGGAAQGVNDTLSDTAANKIEAVKRGFTDWTNSIVGVQGPLGDVAAGVVGMGGDAVTMVGSLGMAAMALRGLGIASGIATAAQWLWNAALSANPIGLVVIAIAALVAGLIWAWNSSETFRGIVIGVWEGVKSAIGAAVDWIGGAISWFGRLPGMIGGWFGQMKDAAIRKASELVGWVRGLPGMVMGAIGNFGGMLLGAGRDLLTGLWNGIAGAAGWLRSKVLGFFGSILPGWAKDILGIHSPSTLMRDEVGQFLPAGVGEGIEDGMPGMLAQATAMGEAARDAAAAGLGGGLSVDAMASGPNLPASSWDAQRPVQRPPGSTETAVRFTGNTSDALATVIMQMIRTGQIQIEAGR